MSNIFRKHPLPWSNIYSKVIDANGKTVTDGTLIVTANTVKYLVEKVNKNKQILRTNKNFRVHSVKKRPLLLQGEYFWLDENGFYTKLDFKFGDYLPPENFEVVSG